MLKVHPKHLGTVAILCLQGQMVHGETQILRNSVLSLSETFPDRSSVILDLAQVTRVDAGGLGVMLELREKVQSKGIRFEFMNVSKQIRQLFEITRLDSVFQIISPLKFLPSVSRSRQASASPFASCA